MNSNKKTARIVGALFIMALVLFLIGKAFYEPIISSPDYLDNTYPNRVVVIIGILLEFISALAVVLIPVLLFPILKKHNEVLALGYVSFRLFEAVLLSFAQIYKLSLVKLSQDYLNKGGVDASYFQNIGSSIQSVIYWIDHAGLIYLIVFAIGALILYSALYKSKLIPRWLSIWGLIGAVAILTGSVMATFDISLVLAMLLIIPIALQEQAMAIWFIVKGFNPSAIASVSAKTDIN
ncbi:hypothetical protein CEE34_00680 [Candidatus Aerophobetes bacterium Ae_b3a]|nr:MAG: hypothetical protein CEE34_00680 [Candidatus Aerophobetes bacterium Ae_b3a]